MSSAEAIGRVINDLRLGNIVWNVEGVDGPVAWLLQGNLAQVVDATPYFNSFLVSEREIAMYEDHTCIAPPWEKFCIAYQNTFGNVIAMVTNVMEGDQIEPWETAEPISWDQVRWVLNTFVFMGGWSEEKGQPIPTSGPFIMYESAVAEDGEPLDLHWVHVDQRLPVSFWTNAHMTLLGTLNFMNCRNIELVEPRRPRAEARRVSRTGVTVKEINVFPTGKSTRGAKGERVGGQPMTSVRGHFSEYGEQYGKGKLFGKIEGRFWIPQHARGERDEGDIEQRYVVRP